MSQKLIESCLALWHCHNAKYTIAAGYREKSSVAGLSEPNEDDTDERLDQGKIESINRVLHKLDSNERILMQNDAKCLALEIELQPEKWWNSQESIEKIRRRYQAKVLTQLNSDGIL